MTCFVTSNWIARHGLALAALAFIVVTSLPASAQTTAPFSLRITEKESDLVHTGDPAWQRYASRDLGFQRMNDRNLPFIEITNNLDAPLTEFHLTIGDNRFNFTNDYLGQFALLAESTPGFALSSSTVGNLGDELVVQIGNGGLKKSDGPLRFEIDLDVDALYLGAPYKFYVHPDYRTVLFDIAGVQPYGPQANEDPENSSADNASLWAIFDPAAGAPFPTQHLHLPDVTVGGSLVQRASAAGSSSSADTIYYNQIIRPYGVLDHVVTYQLNGGEEVPEPATALLALFGLACCALSRRGRRGR